MILPNRSFEFLPTWCLKFQKKLLFFNFPLIFQYGRKIIHSTHAFYFLRLGRNWTFHNVRRFLIWKFFYHPIIANSPLNANEKVGFLHQKYERWVFWKDRFFWKKLEIFKISKIWKIRFRKRIKWYCFLEMPLPLQLLSQFWKKKKLMKGIFLGKKAFSSCRLFYFSSG